MKQFKIIKMFNNDLKLNTYFLSLYQNIDTTSVGVDKKVLRFLKKKSFKKMKLTVKLYNRNNFNEYWQNLKIKKRNRKFLTVKTNFEIAKQKIELTNLKLIEKNKLLPKKIKLLKNKIKYKKAKIKFVWIYIKTFFKTLFT